MKSASIQSAARCLGAFIGFLSVFGIVDLFDGTTPSALAAGRVRSAAARPVPIVDAVLNRAANVVLPSPLKSKPNASFSATAETATYLNAITFFPAPKTVYPVGSQNVRWTGRDGIVYSALAFYPRNAPIDGGKFPAVVYSHGLGGSPEQFTYLASAWARCGVVVLCLRHPGSDESIWRGKVRPLAELKEAYQTHWPARDRATAIRAGIDFLYGAHANPGPLGRDLDLDKIGVAGNDLGALAALLVAGQLPPDNGVSLKDPRVSAILALSPPVFCDAEQGAVVYSLIDAPSMSFTGTEDNGIVGITKAYQRRVPFDSIQSDDRYLLTLIGGDHLVYGNRRMKSKQANDAPYHTTISEVSALFWRAYLTDDADAAFALRRPENGAILRNAKFEKIVVADDAFQPSKTETPGEIKTDVSFAVPNAR